MQSFDATVHGETRRSESRGQSKLFQRVYVNCSGILLSILRWLEISPLFGKSTCRIDIFGVSVVLNWNFCHSLGLIILFLKPLKLLFANALIKICRNYPLLSKLSRVFNWTRLMLFPNLMIHFRLSKLWLIDLVMPVFSVADEVDHDILAELALVFHWKTHRPINIFNVLCIDVQNGNLIGLEKISGILGWTWIDGTSCVTNLIVSDYVHSAIYVKIRCFGKTKRLENYTLRTHCRIAMHLHIQNFVHSVDLLLRVCLTHRNWILGLEMGRIMH